MNSEGGEDTSVLQEELASALTALRTRFDAPIQMQVLSWMVTSARISFETRINTLERAALDAAKERNARPQEVVDASRRLNSKSRRAVEATMERFRDELTVGVAARIEQPSGTSTPVSHDVEPSYPLPPEMLAAFAPLALGDELPDLIGTLLKELLEHGRDALTYGNAYLGFLMEQAHPSSAVAALVPAATAEFESLLASLLRIGLLVYPDALRVNEKRFSIAELRAAGGHQILIQQMAIDKVVEQYLRDTVDAWDRELGKWPGIALRDLTTEWDSVVEMFLRRNLIVHKGGRVDESYLNALPATVERPRLGALLQPDVDYVVDGIRRLATLGRSLAILWLPKLQASAEVDGEASVEVVFDLLSEGRWGDAALVCDRFLSGLTTNDTSDQSEHLLKVNRWLATRELADDVDVIRDEVEAWEPPDDGVDWQVARAALLDDAESTVRLLRELAGGGTSVHRLRSWPLLQTLASRHPQVEIALATESPRRVDPRGRRRGGRRRGGRRH